MSESQTPAPVDAGEPAARSATGKRRFQNAGDAMVLLWAALVAYWPALHGGLLWDDAAHLTKLQLRSLHGLWDIWFHLGATAQYYPLLHSLFWLEFRLWGAAPIGYHLCNVVLHSASALLVVLIVRRLELPGAWLAGFVFALHPVCVESVAWMSEQKSTLSGVFYLGSALSYLYFSRTRRRPQYYLALALFVLSLLSKSVTATLPAVLLVIVWWRNGRLDWNRDIRPLSGWLVLGACSGFFTVWVEKTYVRAEGAEFVLTPLQHVLLAGRVVWFYAGKVLWPVNLMFNYPRWTLDPGQWWQYLYPAGLAVLLAAFVLWARRNRGPLAALLIFGGTLTPVLGFLNVYPFRYSYVADHFQYLAALAIIVPVSSLLALAARRVALSKQAAAACGGLLVLGLGALTWRQAHIYSDAETLYRETLERNPASFLARTNLCAALVQTPGRLPDAVAPCEESLRQRPDLAETHLNLALLKVQTPGEIPEAIAELRAALRIRPAYAAAHYDLGKALALSGRFSEAIDEYRAALRIGPDNPDAYLGIGNALLALPGRQQDAIAAFENALRILPCYPDALYGEGGAMMQMPGRSADAFAEFEAALQCQPDYEPALKMLRQLQPGR
jgi:tetratricopeptide (TPR) repeat protein